MSNALAVLIGVLLAYPLTWVEDAVRFKLRRNTPPVTHHHNITIQTPRLDSYDDRLQVLKARQERMQTMLKEART